MVCGDKIKKDSWRFLYVIKESSNLRDKRNVHADCLSGIPGDTKEQNVSYVAAALEVAADPEEKAVLEKAMEAIRS